LLREKNVSSPGHFYDFSSGWFLGFEPDYSEKDFAEGARRLLSFLSS